MTWRGRRGHKYGVAPAPARTYGGVLYASKAEAARAAELDLQMMAGVVSWWIGQPLFRLGVPENTYRPDFLVVPVEGPARVEDVKGHRTRAFGRNLKLWRSYGPCELWIIERGKVTERIPGGGICQVSVRSG